MWCGSDRYQVIQDGLKRKWVVRKLHAPIKSARRMAESTAETVHIFTKFLRAFKWCQMKTWWNRRSLPKLYPLLGNLLKRHSRCPPNLQHCSYQMFCSHLYSQLHQMLFPLLLLKVAGLLGDLLTSETSPPRNQCIGFSNSSEQWTLLDLFC